MPFYGLVIEGVDAEKINKDNTGRDGAGRNMTEQDRKSKTKESD